jgi:hypothetical protein
MMPSGRQTRGKAVRIIEHKEGFPILGDSIGRRRSMNFLDLKTEAFGAISHFRINLSKDSLAMSVTDERKNNAFAIKSDSSSREVLVFKKYSFTNPACGCGSAASLTAIRVQS